VIVELEVRGVRRAVDLQRAGEAWVVRLDGRLLEVRVALVGTRWVLCLTDGASGGEPGRAARCHDVAFDPTGDDLVVHVDGRAVPVRVDDPRGGRVRAAGSGSPGVRPVCAPMPGRVVKVLVAAGDVVAVRQPLVVVEAMKMENELRASIPGTVREVRVADGDPVESGAVLVVIE
jgi:biotin carboxyl carrier protein